MTPHQQLTADMAARRSPAPQYVARHRVTGKLLHQSGLCLTEVSHWGWKGSETQFVRLAKRHGFTTADYRLEAVAP